MLKINIRIEYRIVAIGLFVGLGMWWSMKSRHPAVDGARTPYAREMSDSDLAGLGAVLPTCRKAADSSRLLRVQSGFLRGNENGSKDLYSIFRNRGQDAVLAELEAIGPGSNRRNMILQMFSSLAAVEGGYTPADFRELLRLIDSLPYPEDKSFGNGSELRALGNSLAPDTLSAMIQDLKSPSVKAALGRCLGERLAVTGGDNIGGAVSELGECLALGVVCAWAENLRAFKDEDVQAFQATLDVAGLPSNCRKAAISTFVCSLDQMTGRNMVVSAEQVCDDDLREDLLVEGYAKWINEDSMSGSASLLRDAPSLPDSLHDRIVEKLVSWLDVANDVEAARQWALTVRDFDLRERLLSGLSRAGFDRE